MQRYYDIVSIIKGICHLREIIVLTSTSSLATIRSIDDNDNKMSLNKGSRILPSMHHTLGPLFPTKTSQ